MKSCLDCEYYSKNYINLTVVRWYSKIHGIIRDVDLAFDVCEDKIPIRKIKEELFPLKEKNES